MPTFIYTCPDGHHHERFYGFTDKKPKAITCHCKKKARKQIGNFSTILKGQPGYMDKFKPDAQ